MSSSLCIIDLFADDMGYAEMNNLARQVISYALDNNIGAQFNSPDYSETLIKSHRRQFFVALSDSFYIPMLYSLRIISFLILLICLLRKRIFPNDFTFYEKSSILFLQVELSVRTFICRKIATMM